MKEHKRAEVLRAIADGKEVQRKFTYESDWADYNLAFHCSPLDCIDDIEWRVKPEPKPDYFLYGGYEASGDGGGLYVKRGDVGISWTYRMKITIDGETNEPKSVELVK